MALHRDAPTETPVGIRTGPTPPISPLMLERELPCSDCGTDLREQLIPATDLPVPTQYDGSVRIAVCPDCNARYYPHETLEQLSPPRQNHTDQ